MTGIAHEPLLRMGSFAVVFLVMALWELASPRRPRPLLRRTRWPGNLGILVIDTALLRVVFPTAAVGAAVVAREQGWGLMPAVGIDGVIAVVLGVLVLDMAIYFQHRLFHALPPLWRLHRMHHTDTDIDVTTGLRFHPLEILLSMLIKLAIVVALGPPAAAVLIFEVLLNATSQFNHSNVLIPERIDRVLRLLVVTPDMHRVHHSVVHRETDSNFGFNIPWWDRWFGTYRAQPAAGQLGMTIGLHEFRSPEERGLVRMLTQPFRNADPEVPVHAGGS